MDGTSRSTIHLLWSAPHHVVHALGRRDGEPGQDVLVALHHREGRVTEYLHDHAFGHARGEQDRRRRVTQVVEAQALLLAGAEGDAGLAADLAKGPGVQLIVGLGYFIVPEALNAQFGTLNAVALALARFYGATVLPIAYVAWVAAGAPGSSLKLAFVRVSAVTPLLGLVVTAIVYPTGVVNLTQALVQVLIAAVFVIGLGYYGWVARGEVLGRS